VKKISYLGKSGLTKPTVCNFEHRLLPFEHRLLPFEHRLLPFEHRLLPFEHRLLPFEHRLLPFEHRLLPFEHRLLPFEHRLLPFEHRLLPWGIFFGIIFTKKPVLSVSPCTHSQGVLGYPDGKILSITINKINRNRYLQKTTYIHTLKYTSPNPLK